MAANLLSPLTEFLPNTWQASLYQVQQNAKAAFSLSHKEVSNKIRDFWIPAATPESHRLSPALLKDLTQQRDLLLAEDWQDAEAGIYPKSVLFDDDWSAFATTYPRVCLDHFPTWQRVANKEAQVFDRRIDTTHYPDYYLQNFHHQTDGYLGEQSAELYDLQVEILFNGTADAMRRRLLKPLKQALGNRHDRPLKILDVACGTGRTLKYLTATFPGASLHGLDLSPTYLAKAGQLLTTNGIKLPQLIQGNAEQQPFQTNWFDALTCVYLFHELPAKVRQTVLAECFRVLKPGGVLIVMDSIQLSDQPAWESMFENFPVMFHEPYYRHYLTDNIGDRLESIGFTEITEQPHCFSKSWLAIKPAR